MCLFYHSNKPILCINYPTEPTTSSNIQHDLPDKFFLRSFDPIFKTSEIENGFWDGGLVGNIKNTYCHFRRVKTYLKIKFLIWMQQKLNTSTFLRCCKLKFALVYLDPNKFKFHSYPDWSLLFGFLSNKNYEKAWDMDKYEEPKSSKFKYLRLAEF